MNTDRDGSPRIRPRRDQFCCLIRGDPSSSAFIRVPFSSGVPMIVRDRVLDLQTPTGTMRVCLGGHLAFRAALNADVAAAACFYPTDIHSAMLGEGQKDDTLARCGELKGELLLVFGRQDPHVPFEGRLAIMKALHAAGVCYTWHEFNAEHAFMRDEGARFDPEAADLCIDLAAGLFHRAL